MNNSYFFWKIKGIRTLGLYCINPWINPFYKHLQKKFTKIVSSFTKQNLLFYLCVNFYNVVLQSISISKEKCKFEYIFLFYEHIFLNLHIFLLSISYNNAHVNVCRLTSYKRSFWKFSSLNFNIPLWVFSIKKGFITEGL